MDYGWCKCSGYNPKVCRNSFAEVAAVEVVEVAAAVVESVKLFEWNVDHGLLELRHVE